MIKAENVPKTNNNINDNSHLIIKKEEKKNELNQIIEIKKSVNSSDISEDSKDDENKEENHQDNKKLLLKVNQTNVKNEQTNKYTELNTNAYSKGIESSIAAPEGKFSSTLLYSNNANFAKDNMKLSNIQKDFIRQTLCQHFLFKDTTNRIITNLINLMEVEKLEPNQVLYEEKCMGDKFYIVKEGTLEETFKNKQQPIIYREGDTFGELALLEKRQREGRMTSKDNVVLYSLKGQLFRSIVQKRTKKNKMKDLNSYL